MKSLLSYEAPILRDIPQEYPQNFVYLTALNLGSRILIKVEGYERYKNEKGIEVFK
jgi:hypothetical protein